MNSKKIDKLVAVSYKGNYLDQTQVNKIASLISRSDLKKYINGLELAEKKKSLLILSPVNNQDVARFQKLFPHKKIVLKKDPSLMLGIKVVDNDIVYEFTLRNSLDKILNHIEQTYD
jgi:F0F1-type ATP synthase delta subunit